MLPLWANMGPKAKAAAKENFQLVHNVVKEIDVLKAQVAATDTKATKAKKLGKTKVRQNTLDPKFYERWTLRVPVVSPPEGGDAVTFEIWEHDMLTADDFMGRVIVPHAELVRPLNGLRRPVVGRAGHVRAIERG